MQHTIKQPFKKVCLRTKLLTLLFLFTSAYSVAQQLSYDCFRDAAEKVFVTTPNQQLIAGDTLQYSATILEAATNKPSSKSNFLYFQLLSPSNSEVASWLTKTENGCAQGTVVLPDTLSAGIYSLKAYTQWMHNNNDGFGFSMPLLIFPLSENEINEINIPAGSKARIDVVAEGGTLVAGKQNRTMVSVSPLLATNRVAITNPGDSIVGSATINSAGIAYIDWTPNANTIYHVTVSSENGTSVSAVMPNARVNALSLKVTDNGGHFTIEPLSTSDLPHGLKIQLWCRGHLVNDYPVTANTMNVQKTSLPHGVISVELIDTSGQTVGQRLIYNHATLEESEKLDFPSDIKTRSQATVGVGAMQKNKLLSITVKACTPIDSLTKCPCIDDYLNFWSEISTAAAPYSTTLSFNDILFNTNTSDYLWDRHALRVTNRFRERDGFTVSGYIANKTDGKPLANTILFLSTPSPFIALKYSVTDSLGHFNFILSDEWLNKNLIVQADPLLALNDNVHWTFDNKNLIVPLGEANTLGIDSTETALLTEKGSLKLINSVFYPQPSKIDSTANVPIPSNHRLLLKPSFTIVPADFEDLNNFEELASNILPLVRFNKKKSGITFEIYSTTMKSWMDNCMLILNGVPFNDLEYLSTLGSKDIAKVEIYNTPLLYGDLTFTGLLAVYTHAGKLPTSYVDKQTQRLYIKPVEQTASKNIPTPLLLSPTLPSVSQTLMFVPFSPIDDANDKLELTTSDLTGVYTILVQGISTDGKPLVLKKQFHVSTPTEQ